MFIVNHIGLIRIRKSPGVKLMIVNIMINFAFLSVLCSTLKLDHFFLFFQSGKEFGEFVLLE